MDMRINTKMDLKMVDINAIIPYEKNPRKNSVAVDKVAASIKEFGFQQPIVVDAEGVIIVGHTRHKAALKLGLTEVPVVYAVNLTDEQVKAYRLADNKTAEFAEWDADLLAGELLELTTLDFDMVQFGFEAPAEAEEDSFDLEKELGDITEPVTKLGDIWQLGKHRLMCGDSTDKETVEKLMGGVKADLFLTDPPYNVDYVGKTKDALKIQNDKMGNDRFSAFLVDAFAAADHVMKPGAVFYIWHADSEGYNFRGACQDVGWQVRQCLIWNKNTMVMGRQDYHWKHEPCLYGWKSGAGHLWATDRKQTTIINFDKPSRNEMHPTMKPVGLFDYQIKNNTKGEDIVLDTFAGSGTTIVACEQNGRTAYCMELDPKYTDVCIKRWEDLTGLKAELIS